MSLHYQLGLAKGKVVPARRPSSVRRLDTALRNQRDVVTPGDPTPLDHLLPVALKTFERDGPKRSRRSRSIDSVLSVSTARVVPGETPLTVAPDHVGSTPKHRRLSQLYSNDRVMLSSHHAPLEATGDLRAAEVSRALAVIRKDEGRDLDGKLADAAAIGGEEFQGDRRGDPADLLPLAPLGLPVAIEPAPDDEGALPPAYVDNALRFLHNTNLSFASVAGEDNLESVSVLSHAPPSEYFPEGMYFRYTLATSVAALSNGPSVDDVHAMEAGDFARFTTVAGLPALGAVPPPSGLDPYIPPGHVKL